MRLIEGVKQIAETGKVGKVQGNRLHPTTAKAIKLLYEKLDNSNKKLFESLSLAEMARYSYFLLSEANVDLGSQSSGDLGKTLSDIASDPNKKNQLVQALNKAGSEAQSSQQTNNNQQGDADARSVDTGAENETETDQNIQQALQRIGATESHKRRHTMRMPKALKESINSMNVAENDFSAALQRRLREAKKKLSERKYNQYKGKLVEYATKDPRKFVAFIGSTDRKLAESYRGFGRLRKTITEGKKPSVRASRKKVAENRKSTPAKGTTQKGKTRSKRARR